MDAVNTVVFHEDGRRTGDNTDIPGMVAALREHGIEEVEHAAILGAGATASSALAALARICRGEVTAYVRSEARAAEMRRWGERLGVAVRTADWADAAQALRRPAGRRHHPGRCHGPARPRPCPTAPAALFDVLYDPWPTPLAAPGPRTAARSSAVSTCWCTRRCSRWSR